ncbi:hypothetical protein E8E14_002267 [Neopestalotiopsis sp. 37M]|nr:hypothetical protein E8E14_002267 [Neopestalotiopsis sp. 37M]
MLFLTYRCYVANDASREHRYGTRFYQQQKRNLGIWWDDSASLAALILCLGLVPATIICATVSHAGYHISTYTIKELVVFIKAIVAKVLYSSSVAMSKFSVLFLYRRLFSVAPGTKFLINIMCLLMAGSKSYIFGSGRNSEDIANNASEELQNLAKDARRFLLSQKGGIELAPLQTYTSALIFSPSNSLVKKLFHKESPGWINSVLKVETDWNACLQTLEGHSDSVCSVAISPDGRRLAFGSRDNTVKL